MEGKSRLNLDSVVRFLMELDEAVLRVCGGTSLKSCYERTGKDCFAEVEQKLNFVGRA